MADTRRLGGLRGHATHAIAVRIKNAKPVSVTGADAFASEDLGTYLAGPYLGVLKSG